MVKRMNHLLGCFDAWVPGFLEGVVGEGQGNGWGDELRVLDEGDCALGRGSEFVEGEGERSGGGCEVGGEGGREGVADKLREQTTKVCWCA